ncbi:MULTISPECIES: AEC family transporter [unclassified Acinetobacter]|uniref:AEC family transporter n=1 Tax=unclassified Acinetobacter TaxID=196816 RepID=UPI0029346658|nr:MULTISPECIES: AEC family transporter [unclassified Acinetobacter]WOE32672.1 AEC family transporter [Acinetobacter sp. SAAs470]WOE38148.1 AEC family transporter [Acinetobacter sp. SAAs474]
MNFWDGAERLNYYILFPSLLFLSLAKVETNILDLKSTLMIIAIVISIIIITTYLIAKIRKTPIQRIGVYIQSFIRFNTYIGLSIALSFNNEQIKSILVSILALSIPVVNIVSIISLTAKSELNFTNITIALIKNPLINSCILGIICNYFSIPIWQGLESLLVILSNSSLMLGLLCVGSAIELTVIMQHYQKALAVSLIRLILIPSFVILLSYFIPLASVNLIAIMIFFSIPTASSAYILTKILKGDHELMAGIISLQTILSAFSLPLMIYLIR